MIIFIPGLSAFINQYLLTCNKKTARASGFKKDTIGIQGTS